MFYPNILRLLAQQRVLPLYHAHKLWDQAAAHSTAGIDLTPDDSPDWERVISSFLESIRCDARVISHRRQGANYRR